MSNCHEDDADDDEEEDNDFYDNDDYYDDEDYDDDDDHEHNQTNNIPPGCPTGRTFCLPTPGLVCKINMTTFK